MTTEQIILYLFIALIIYYVGKKFYLIKSIKQYTPADAYAKVKNKRNVVLAHTQSKYSFSSPNFFQTRVNNVKENIVTLNIGNNSIDANP